MDTALAITICILDFGRTALELPKSILHFWRNK